MTPFRPQVSLYEGHIPRKHLVIGHEWKDNMESKGMRVSMNKTKVMISGERQKVRQKAVRWPCGVCSKGVGSNLIQCTSC